ncbi:MAG: MMPL family transporter [Chloroflexi bacterium]|uniref:MMPL family transporter n=1 Tax=Candidatus Chlorohelix allophototropha TaxID=3003348 RepID=A0A8T7M409_9CHLR|nr:MMPL family transporter [Chloroflexota bacterium]WJW70212.1 MMPL family transporter [Chloroflexota bacterium L227-S17]
MPSNTNEKRIYKKAATVRIAMWSARHRWLTVTLWMIFTIGLFIISLVSGGTKTSDGSNPTSGSYSKTESYQAGQVYNAGVANNAPPSSDSYIVITHPSLKTTDPQFKEMVSKVVQGLQAITYSENGANKPSFANVINPYEVPATAGLIAPDGSALRIVATTLGTSKERSIKLEPLKSALVSLKAQSGDFKISVLNYNWLNDDINRIVSEDLDGSLKITMPLTFGILLLAFGALAAAFVPLILAITALLAAFGFLGLYSQFVTPVSQYATQLIVLIGLAVAVDYSLFMLTRFRAERRNGRDKMTAIEITSSTAGRAVFFSGITVAISIAGLYLLDDDLFRSMATGTIAVVLLSIIGSLTFLPATLSIMGNGINWGRIPYFGREREEGSGFWSPLVGGVMRRPFIAAFVTTLLLLFIAFPVLNLRMGLVGVESFPNSIEGVATINLMNQKWPQGTTLKMNVVVTGANNPDVKVAMDKFREAGLKTAGLSEPSAITISQNGTAGRITFTMGGGENDQANIDLVKKVRKELVPAYFSNLGIQAFVSGDTAQVVDIVKIYTDAMPLVFAFVLGLSFLLLLIAFHSLVIPVTAIILNLLSTSAAYGAMVLVFQEGWFDQQIGIKTTGVIESWVPVFIFTILFGLSMDYHLFILTRIKETKDKGANSNEAVAKGISATSGVITSAAAIMVMVFAVFVTLQLVIIKQVGLGLAVAVFVDATLIRSLLLPATMRLLGKWNWYIPKFLDWIPQVTIEGEPEDASDKEKKHKVAV